MFDAKDEGLTEFQKNLTTLLNQMPKETKTILRKAGSKARTIVARKARSLVKKHTGYYHKKFKRGKVWQEEDGTYRVRVYNNSPHAHLLEDGHRIVGKDGSEHGFQPGYKVLDKANKEVEDQWDDILEKEIDKLIDKM
jgi:HK97 gp10 family phage protein